MQFPIDLLDTLGPQTSPFGFDRLKHGVEERFAVSAQRLRERVEQPSDRRLMQFQRGDKILDDAFVLERLRDIICQSRDVFDRRSFCQPYAVFADEFLRQSLRLRRLVAIERPRKRLGAIHQPNCFRHGEPGQARGLVPAQTLGTAAVPTPASSRQIVPAPFESRR